MLIKLSYNLSEHTPFYSSLPKPKLNPIYDLTRGDACNSFYFTTSNHCGTHVDAPRHFHTAGRSITDYSLDEFHFTRPAVVNVPLQFGELITPAHLAPALAGLPPDIDILLLHTGFGAYRADERRYMDLGPGFGPEAAFSLMDRCPALRALAVDFPSISSLSHEDAGAEAHRVFLGVTAYQDRPILLIEDALLPAELPPLRRAVLMPWLFDGLDSAPCTLFAETGPHV